MKKLILCMLLALFCTTGNAEVTREGDTFRTENTVKSTGTRTKYTWEDKDNNRYPVFITKNGACYILRTSKKTGREYKYYLPKKVQETIRKELNI